MTKRGHGQTRVQAPSCSSGKRSYRRRRSAVVALRFMQSVGYSVRVVYRCPECGWYHLSRPKRKAA